MHKRLLTIAVILLIVFALGGLGLFLAYPSLNAEHIYAGVSVSGIDVGDLTVAQATARLRRELPDPAAQTLRLEGGPGFTLTWADVGQGYDVQATAQAAYRVGREGDWFAQVLAPWQINASGVDIEPRLTPADPARVTAWIAALAPQLAIAPTEASLTFAAGAVTATPAQPGRGLDVERSAQAVLNALAQDLPTTQLIFAYPPPVILEADPAYTQAQALLARPFTLIADDPLTNDYYAEFALSPAELSAWLSTIRRPAARQLELRINPQGIAAWLEALAPELGEERILDVPVTRDTVLAALQNGDYAARAHIRHPARTYVVQPGNYFFDIAYSFGFPQYQLERANPDVDPNALNAWQTLIIPSIDVLFPHPLPPGKRIEIDLPTQTLTAIQDNETLMELRISSGMSTTPTLAGQFQILFKVEDAYAQRWALDMPYFMGIYEEAPGFYNGIHERPITRSGYRLSRNILGWPASFGCIIVDVEEARLLFEWADIGTLVRIRGVAPGTPSGTETLDQIVDTWPSDSP